MTVDVWAREVGPVQAKDCNAEPSEAVLEEGYVEQPAEEERRVAVPEKEAGEHDKRHYEEWTEDHSVLKLKNKK